MEVDQIQCKFQTFGNGNGTLNATKVAQNRKMDDQYPDEEDDGEREQIPAGRGGGRVDLGGGVGRFYGWPSSRIVRVTRASGGKDRHSKVLTSKGLRDRRVRLSVNTAIQFYDLQDRLGYDQPSKAVEWLLNAAASSIAELPPINPPFPDTPKQVSDEKRSSTAGSDQVGLDATADTAMDGCGGEPSYLQQVTKSSACSSNSETSKGSGLSLSRSEHRIKARERARERAAEKDKDKDQNEGCHVPSLNPNSQITSFTELLSGGFNNVVHNSNHETSNRQWSSPSMDYLTTGLLGAPGQMQFVNSLKRNPNPSPQFTVTSYFNSELQNLEFGTEGQMVNGNDNHENNGSSGSYNLNFGISSAGVAGYNRGTLQSNSSSSSLLPPVHSHRFGSSSTGFLMAENHPHEFQLFYGRNGGQKGKGKD